MLALSSAFPTCSSPRGPIAWCSVQAASNSKALSQRQTSALHSLIGGPAWSASKAFQTVLLDSDRCQLCGHSPGTFAHRRFHCPIWDLRRREHISPPTAAAIATLDDLAQEQPGRVLGVFTAAMAPAPLAGDAAIVSWWPPGLAHQDRHLTGRIFTDGSCLFPYLGLPSFGGVGMCASRCTVSVVQSCLRPGAGGPCSHTRQRSSRRLRHTHGQPAMWPFRLLSFSPNVRAQ